MFNSGIHQPQASAYVDLAFDITLIMKFVCVCVCVCTCVYVCVRA